MKPSNVLLVVPPSPIIASKLVEIEASMQYEDNSSPHLGIGYLASSLSKQGFKVGVYDSRFEQDLPLNIITNKILEREPKIIGFTTTTNTYNNVIRLSYILKKEYPNIKIVVGGPHISARINSHPFSQPISKKVMKELGLHKYSMAEACLRGIKFESEDFPTIKRDKLIDAVVIGDCFNGQKLFEVLADGKNLEERLEQIKGIAYIDSKDRFRFTEENQIVKDLSSLARPARQLFPMKKYLVPGTIITSHGCPMFCSYCTCPSTTDRRYITRKVQDTIEEILEMYNQFGIDKFRINDDVATTNKKWMQEFSNSLIELKSKGISFKWSCFARVDQVNKQLLELMKYAGCVTVQYGIETGSNEILSSINKGNKATMDRAIYAVKSAVDAEIPLVRAGFIVGFPEDTKETICETFDLIHSLYEIGKGRIEVGIAALTPYPGSLDGDKAIQGYYEYKRNGTTAFRPIDFNFDRYIFQEVNVVNRAFSTFESMSHAYGTLFGATQQLRREYERHQKVS